MSTNIISNYFSIFLDFKSNNCVFTANQKFIYQDPCIEKNMKLADIDSDDEHDAVWYNVRVVNNGTIIQR